MACLRVYVIYAFCNPLTMIASANYLQLFVVASAASHEAWPKFKSFNIAHLSHLALKELISYSD